MLSLLMAIPNPCITYRGLYNIMIEKQQPDIKYLVNEVNDLQSQIV